MASSVKPHDTFHLFPRLPAELRLRVWDLNLPPARLIPVRCGSDLPSDLPSDLSRQPPPFSLSSRPPGCSSPAPIPVNLHTCSESRAHALTTRYTHSLAFARSSQGCVILDYQQDVLYFPPARGYMAAPAQFHTCMSLCDPADLRRIRRIALHEDMFSCHYRQPHQQPKPTQSPKDADGSIHDDSQAADDGEALYWSSLAVGMTTECLRLVRDRMPAVQDIIFVSRGYPENATRHAPADLGTPERLMAQVETSMRDLAATAHGDWMPTWSIAVEPTAP